MCRCTKEFFIGITPGYVSGASSNPSKVIYGSSLLYQEESWTEKKNAISVSIDAGMCLGEGCGAAALFPLLDMAAEVYGRMETFDDMRITQYERYGSEKREEQGE